MTLPRLFLRDSRHVTRIVAAANVEPRRLGPPDMIVLHYTGMLSAARAVQWLASAESRVSCHYVVDERGEITQMVPERLRAWHAGVAYWAGETDINSRAIGIEIHNPGHELDYWDFSDAQISGVIALCRDITQRYGIKPQRVLAHSDVAPERKIDPGEKFPWAKLAAAGIGHWCAPEPIDDADAGLESGATGDRITGAQLALARYGYRIDPTGVLDTATSFALRAFQLHFRPARVDKRLDRSTEVTLQRLIEALPAPLTS
jgi:N-acetylmuramoyl-L-alanine amidase